MGVKRKLHEHFNRYRLCLHLMDGSEEAAQEAYRAFVESVDKAVGRLPEMERRAIQGRYMGEDLDYISDKDVFDQMGISSATFMKIRNRAFKKLAALWGYSD
ncbi:hypothetical protein ABEW34_01840 [Paenibacillus algorifonticola]|uniref:hypothetical protein n=1 Tax=Paenibacillus algorifonticola TaxID=684063 RepID=UPI003D29A1AB